MIPRHLCNPRRAYDANGRELAPMTVANAQKNRTRGITARCPATTRRCCPSRVCTRFVPDCEASSGAVRLRVRSV